MTEALKRAFEEVSRLPEVEQDAFAARILQDLAAGPGSEDVPPDWTPSLALQQMVERALEQERRGEATSMDEFLAEEDN